MSTISICSDLTRLAVVLLIVSTQVFLTAQGVPSTGAPWPRHTIDDSSSGADGVRVADVNSDGLPDLVTGWEEGGITRVYIHPGTGIVTQKWPAVTVGRTSSVEDAVFADLDGDGSVDVVSSCEGATRTVFVHWAPRDRSLYLNSDSWTTEPIPATVGRTQWMFALPMDVDGENGLDLVLGSKGDEAVIGWLESPADPRRLEDWRFRELYKAGWIMSLIEADMDGDDDTDIVVSDRKGATSGVLWLEHPGPNRVKGTWPEHRIGADGAEVMFLDLATNENAVPTDLFAAVNPDEIHRFHHSQVPAGSWSTEVIKVEFPLGVGRAKGIRTGDLDLDGRIDITYSCEGANPPKRGLVWLRNQGPDTPVTWEVRDISGPEGIKFDRIEFLDLDGDGDLDVVTCEENAGTESRGLGVIWYENPYR